MSNFKKAIILCSCGEQNKCELTDNYELVFPINDISKEKEHEMVDLLKTFIEFECSLCKTVQSFTGNPLHTFVCYSFQKLYPASSFCSSSFDLDEWNRFRDRVNPPTEGNPMFDIGYGVFIKTAHIDDHPYDQRCWSLVVPYVYGIAVSEKTLPVGTVACSKCLQSLPSFEVIWSH